jgi:DNA polymerase-3 subunit alpha
MSDSIMLPEPPIPQVEQWSLLEKLNKEKDVTGIFISGHPLDDYRVEIEHFMTCTIDSINNHQNKPTLQVGGMVTKTIHRVSKNGNGWGIFEISDYTGAYEIKLFGEDYQKFRHLLTDGIAIFVKGRFQKGWKDDGEMDFKVLEVRLLEGIALSMTPSGKAAPRATFKEMACLRSSIPFYLATVLLFLP